MATQLKYKKMLSTILTLSLILCAGLFLLSCLASRPNNLGVSNGKLTPCPDSPNCVCSQGEISDDTHYISPLSYSENSSDEATQAIETAIANAVRSKVILQENNYWHIEFTSAIFRFTDDVEIYIDTEDEMIHFRSASRIGHSDLGANRKRIEALKKAISNALQKASVD